MFSSSATTKTTVSESIFAYVSLRDTNQTIYMLTH